MKENQIMIWMVKMGLEIDPKVNYNGAEFSGDPHQTLNDSIGLSNQTHPSPVKPGSLQTKGCRPSSDLGPLKLGQDRSTLQGAVIYKVV